MLFAHRDLLRPAELQISSYWQDQTPIRLNLAPETDLPQALARTKATSRKLPVNELATLMPSRLAERLVRWELTPTGTQDYKRPRSRPAALPPATCPRKPWNPNSLACIS